MVSNILWFSPEIFLTAATVLLLGYGVIYSKLDGVISQQKKITWLTIIVLALTIMMIVDQYNIINSPVNYLENTKEGNTIEKVETIYIAQGLYGIDTTIIGIKIAVLTGSIGVLLLSLSYYAPNYDVSNEPGLSPYGKKEDFNSPQPKSAKLQKPTISPPAGGGVTNYEYTQLILLSTLGMLLLVSSKDLISLYLSIELISLSLYILAGIKRDGQYSTEASIKYFLLGAVSSGLLLFGSALMYWLTGETCFIGLSNYIWYAPLINNGLNGVISQELTSLTIAAMFIVVALLFKLAAAPFHMWAPDVYEGSPTIVTAYFAIVPKIATLGILYQLLLGPFSSLFYQLEPLLIFCAILSIVIGSLGAINQTKIKRLLAYSAIGHMGFMLIGLSTGALNGLFATFVYIAVYMLTTFNTFAFVLSFTSSTPSLFTLSQSLNSPLDYQESRSVFNKQNTLNEETNFISQLAGLSRVNPLLALTFTLGLFSMAGIPPLAGFFSKYLILLSVFNQHLYFLAFVAILFSVVASFYYIRLIKWMYFRNSSDYTFKILANISMQGLDHGLSLKSGQSSLSSQNIAPFYSANSPLNITLINSLILGSTLWVLVTFILYPNPLFNFIFGSLVTSVL